MDCSVANRPWRTRFHGQSWESQRDRGRIIYRLSPRSMTHRTDTNLGDLDPAALVVGNGLMKSVSQPLVYVVHDWRKDWTPSIRHFTHLSRVGCIASWSTSQQCLHRCTWRDPRVLVSGEEKGDRNVSPGNNCGTGLGTGPDQLGRFHAVAARSRRRREQGVVVCRRSLPAPVAVLQVPGQRASKVNPPTASLWPQSLTFIAKAVGTGEYAAEALLTNTGTQSFANFFWWPSEISDKRISATEYLSGDA